MGVPRESTELWEGTHTLLGGKSQASVGVGPLFCGGKDLEGGSPHRGCSPGSIGREPQSLISLQATTFLKHLALPGTPG